MGSTPYLLTPQWGTDTCEKALAYSQAHEHTHIYEPTLGHPSVMWLSLCSRPVLRGKEGLFMLMLNSASQVYRECSFAVILLLLSSAFRIGLWEDLASIKWCWEDLGLMGPSGSFCLQSPLLFSKAKGGCKFEREDSVQIAVTLGSKGNQAQERRKN